MKSCSRRWVPPSLRCLRGACRCLVGRAGRRCSVVLMVGRLALGVWSEVREASNRRPWCHLPVKREKSKTLDSMRRRHWTLEPVLLRWRHWTSLAASGSLHASTSSSQSCSNSVVTHRLLSAYRGNSSALPSVFCVVVECRDPGHGTKFWHVSRLLFSLDEIICCFTVRSLRFRISSWLIARIILNVFSLCTFLVGWKSFQNVRSHWGSRIRHSADLIIQEWRHAQQFRLRFFHRRCFYSSAESSFPKVVDIDSLQKWSDREISVINCSGWWISSLR